MTKFNGNLLLDMQIAFGGVAGCRLFGRPADTWKHIMLNEFNLVAIFRWLENNLFVKEIGEHLGMKTIVQLSNELGVETNKEKGVEFQTEQKYIGFIWNGD
jgi:hypothetical protein